MKRILLCQIITLFWLPSSAQTIQQLKDSAATFPVMPLETADMFPFALGVPTFGSGTPFNDLEYTLYDTDYIDGENGGSDVFLPADPSETFPGANKVKLIRCVLNTDLNENYRSADADRIILGTFEHPNPFFLRGSDGADNDYAVIQHLDFDNGYIQLKGQAADYDLVYCTLADGCLTEGWYLFYTANNQIDLVAFIYPCWAIEPAVSGNPPQNLNPLCNGDSTLSLLNPDHFKYAEPVSAAPVFNSGIIQLGSDGKEIVGGMTTDDYGYVYLFGATDGNLDGNADSEHEIFVAKVNPNGNREWTTELAMEEGTLLFDAVADQQYLYVCGRTLGQLPGFTNAGKWDGILLKLNLSDGQIVASDQWGNQGIDGYGNIILDDAGNLFVSGQGSPANVTGTDSLYLAAKHSTSALANVWRVLDPVATTNFSMSAEAWGGLTYQQGSVPGNGKLIVAGWYLAGNGANGFISVYNQLNAATPARPYSVILASPGMRADWVLDNTIDSRGNIYVAGYTTGNLLGGHQGNGDAFVIRYDSTLSNPVIKQFGTPQTDMIRKLEIDANNTLYAVGYS
ncbi:MAG: SBBP repeat-containing protein, partial [Bacteroidia bacterium]